jgi:hypothetical protein
MPKSSKPSLSISHCTINGPELPNYKTALEALARAVEANANAIGKLAAVIVDGPPISSTGIMIQQTPDNTTIKGSPDVQ